MSHLPYAHTYFSGNNENCCTFGCRLHQIQQFFLLEWDIHFSLKVKISVSILWLASWDVTVMLCSSASLVCCQLCNTFSYDTKNALLQQQRVDIILSLQLTGAEYKYMHTNIRYTLYCMSGVVALHYTCILYGYIVRIMILLLVVVETADELDKHGQNEI